MKEIEGKARKTAYVDVPMHLFWAAVGVAGLAYIFFTRDSLPTHLLFFGTVIFAIPTGGLIGIVLNRFS